jgi:WD40 repeat protein/serine/threonine protein kinase
MGHRPLDDPPGPAGNGTDDPADRQFAEALAAYDEALATGQAVSATSELTDSQRLADARAVLRLLHQIHSQSSSAVQSEPDTLSLKCSAVEAHPGGTPPARGAVSGPVGDLPGFDRTRHKPEDRVPEPLLIGGRYAPERILGRGGMGVVYLARDRSLHRLVAVKMIALHKNPLAESVPRFWAEAEAAGRLKHPNLVAVHDVGMHHPVPEDPPQPYLVMEYIAGGTLRDRLTGHPWPERPAAQLLETLARAIHHAHQHQIIHRDLKPANILLARQERSVESREPDKSQERSVESREPEKRAERADWDQGRDTPLRLSTLDIPLLTPKIADFGVAKQLDTGAGLTQSGEVIGTPQYMAPEQAQGRGHEIGPATDVYALGAILYELLTGRPPFQGVMPLDIQLRVICEEPLPLRRLQPALARDLETICLKCLEKEPHRRYPSAAALADDLARFLAGQPIVARPISRRERLWKWARRQPVVAGLLAAVALVTVLGVAGITWQWRNAAAGWAHADDQREHAEAAEADAVARAAAERDAHQATRRAEAQARASADAEASARRAVAAEKERVEWGLYGSRMALAIHGWQDCEPRVVRQYLDTSPQRFRHWEYAYLHRLRGSNQQTWKIGNAVSPIHSVAIAPDGSRVAIAQANGHLHVTTADLAKQPVWLRTGFQGECTVCFSPDGRRFAAMQHKKASEARVGVWDATDGRKLWSVPIQVPGGRICFSADGQRLLYGERGTVRIVDASTGKEQFALPGQGAATHVACSPDGRWIASAGGDGRVKVWDTASRQIARTLQGFSGGIMDLAVSPDGRHLAAGGWDSTIRVWELPGGELRQVLQGHTRAIMSIAFSPDGSRLVSGSWDRSVRLWDVATGQPLRTLRGHASWALSVAFFPDGQRVMSGGVDGLLIIWDATQDQECRRLSLTQGAPRGASLSPDGKRVAVVTDYQRVCGVDATTGQVAWDLPLPKGRAVKFSPDGRWLLVSAQGGSLQRLDAADGKLLRTIADDAAGVSAFALDRQGQRVAYIGSDRMLIIQNALTGQVLVRGEELPEDFGQGPLCFSSDGRRLFLGSNKGRLQVRDTATGAVQQTLAGHYRAIHCLAVSADGRYLATGSADQTLKLWDAASLKERAILRGHAAHVTAVTFSPDGERLVSGCYSRTLKIWCTANGQEVLPLPGHLAAITALEFSADGRWLLSSSEDGTARLWDAGEQSPSGTAKGDAGQ